MPFKADIDYVKKRKNDALERSLHFNIAGGEKKGKFVHLQWHIRIRVCGILLKNEWKTKKKTKNTWIMWSEHGISVRCSHLRRKSHLMIDCVTRQISHVQSIGLVINSFANCNSRFFCTVCIGFSSIQIHLNDMRIFAPAILNCIQLVGGHFAVRHPHRKCKNVSIMNIIIIQIYSQTLSPWQGRHNRVNKSRWIQSYVTNWFREPFDKHFL